MTNGLLLAAVMLLAASALIFARNQPNRRYIQEALADAPPVGRRAVAVPERLIGYGAAELNAFKNALKAKRRSDSETALDFYIRPVLLWKDVGFAVTLGCFATAFWGWIGLFFHATGHLRWLCIFGAVMGFLYGCADVAEDIYLAKILAKPGPVSDDEARTANNLTLAKFGAITLSVAGAAAFLMFQQAFPQKR